MLRENWGGGEAPGATCLLNALVQNHLADHSFLLTSKEERWIF